VYQPTYGGGFLYGAYRIGDGDFPVWYKEWLTNEGGQFKVGWGMPLGKNRAIDSRRAGLAQTSLSRQAVEPAIQAQLLLFVRDASEAYWSWVAAGRLVQAQQELLRLAQDRAEQIEARVRAGDLEEIARIDNQRLIATRETKLIESQRKLQAAAIKLSLFLRDEQGQMLIPAEDHLPPAFPDHSAPDLQGLEQDIRTGLAARPELQELDLIRRQVQVDLDYARNQLLPKVDAKLEASKDVGAWAERTGDKTPFELEAGLFGEVPLQRREARGKIQAACGKLAQLAAKREFVANKVEAEVRDAVSALATAHDRIERSRVNLDMAHRSLDLGREAFRLGDITVVTLNLYEQATLEAESLLIEAQADYFQALAAYRAALALDPLAALEPR
jgi:outer membrane protein TolC